MACFVFLFAYSYLFLKHAETKQTRMAVNGGELLNDCDFDNQTYLEITEITLPKHQNKTPYLGHRWAHAHQSLNRRSCRAVFSDAWMAEPICSAHHRPKRLVSGCPDSTHPSEHRVLASWTHPTEVQMVQFAYSWLDVTACKSSMCPKWFVPAC